MSSLHTSLLKTLSATGWRVRSDGSGVSAEREGFFRRWFFGQRSIKFRLELKFDDGRKTLLLRESAIEESTGLFPPSLPVHAEAGRLDFENARKWIAQQCEALGWACEVLAGNAHPSVKNEMAGAVRT